MQPPIENGKSVILYHRSYRKLPGSVQLFLLQFVCMAVPLAALTAYNYPKLTHAICLLAETILSPFYAHDTVMITQGPFLAAVGYLNFLNVPGKYPTFGFSIVNFAISLVLLLFLVYFCKPRPLNICLIPIVTVHMLASCFFAVSPNLFPYDTADYSYLYMVQQISILLFVPFIMGVALLPLPSGTMTKFLTMIATYLYSLTFGTVRYVAILYFLSKASLLYMALLFFAFGPLLDFAYIVGIYSIHVTWLAKKIKGDFSLWRW
ncbi:hypothetical protein [Sporomusa aerivorans]|uniref:hypothetical protein n=1 Tax=Sporomusa aerivorans TaxID=204936 RepID=UPI00352AA86E